MSEEVRRFIALDHAKWLRGALEASKDAAAYAERHYRDFEWNAMRPVENAEKHQRIAARLPEGTLREIISAAQREWMRPDDWYAFQENAARERAEEALRDVELGYEQIVDMRKEFNKKP